MGFKEKIGEIIGGFVGERYISAPNASIPYAEGFPREAQLLREKRTYDRDNTLLDVFRLRIKQGSSKYNFLFVGTVEMRSSRDGETIAALGIRVTDNLSLKKSESNFVYGLHIWWGGKYDMVFTPSNLNEGTIEIMDLGEKGEHLTYKRIKCGIGCLVQRPGRFSSSPQYESMKAPDMIEIIRRGKNGEESVLETNKEEVWPAWEKIYEERERECRRLEKDHALVAWMRRWGGGPSLKGPISLR